MHWYLEALRKYAVFTGRATRKEYWMFFLINTAISIILLFLDNVTGTYSVELGMGVLSGIYALILIVPSISIAVRRLHDSGKSGWWLLILFIPLIGLIAWLVFMTLPSDEGANKYGIRTRPERAL